MSRIRRRKADFSIQLTPMIDVMTVLLAVFMVTTPMMTTGIDLIQTVAISCLKRNYPGMKL